MIISKLVTIAVWYQKILLIVSRDWLTDKQKRVHLALSKSTWSHFSDEKKNFNHTHRNGSKFSFLTSCQFPDLPMVFCESRNQVALAFHHILLEIYPKSGFKRPFSFGSKFSCFESLHWLLFWWRHKYDSWFLGILIESLVHLLDFINFSVDLDALTLFYRSI